MDKNHNKTITRQEYLDIVMNATSQDSSEKIEKRKINGRDFNLRQLLNLFSKHQIAKKSPMP
jgi:hypothetical protein